MKKLLAVCVLSCFSLVMTGCGEKTAAPATEEQAKEIQAPIDDMMEKMKGMGGKGGAETDPSETATGAATSGGGGAAEPSE